MFQFLRNTIFVTVQRVVLKSDLIWIHFILFTPVCKQIAPGFDPTRMIDVSRIGLLGKLKPKRQLKHGSITVAIVIQS